jgi:hypothetical protein
MSAASFPPPNELPRETAELIGRLAESAVWQTAKALQRFPSDVAIRTLMASCREAGASATATPAHAAFMNARADMFEAALTFIACEQKVRAMLSEPCECDECLKRRAGHA